MEGRGGWAASGWGGFRRAAAGGLMGSRRGATLLRVSGAEPAVERGRHTRGFSMSRPSQPSRRSVFQKVGSDESALSRIFSGEDADLAREQAAVDYAALGPVWNDEDQAG